MGSLNEYWPNPDHSNDLDVIFANLIIKEFEKSGLEQMSEEYVSEKVEKYLNGINPEHILIPINIEIEVINVLRSKGYKV